MGAEAWIRFWEQNIQLTPGIRKRLAANNYAALIDHWNAPDPWKVGLQERIKDFPVPSLFYAGEKESVRLGAEEAARLMPKATFKLLGGMNHFDIFIHAEQVLPVVKAFLASVDEL
jgi:pimeloyl-ACP methyl ester carboxylesterase